MEQQRVAIVTGASAGIGMETALALARRRCAVVLAARRADRLEDVARQCASAGGQAMVAVTDVADSEQVDRLVAAAMDAYGRIDVMVNNAGYGLYARVHETTEDQMRRIFDVNYFGVFFGCRAVAPIMIRQRSGHIFNVSSVIGKRGSPFNGAYCATKFALCGLTDSLRVEMMPYGVHVTSVCPGLTDTEFSRHIEGGSRRDRSSFRRLCGLQSARVVGRKIASTVGKRKAELVFTAGGRALVFLSAMFPGLTDRMMKLYHDRQLRLAR